MKSLNPGENVHLNKEFARKVLSKIRVAAKKAKAKPNYHRLAVLAEMSEDKVKAMSSTMDDEEKTSILSCINHLNDIKKHFVSI